MPDNTFRAWRCPDHQRTASLAGMRGFYCRQASPQISVMAGAAENPRQKAEGFSPGAILCMLQVLLQCRGKSGGPALSCDIIRKAGEKRRKARRILQETLYKLKKECYSKTRIVFIKKER